MIFEILIAALLGIFFGIFTGLTPGIHINLVSLFLLSISGWLLNFTSPIVLAAFIVAMGVTHTFLDTIPSIFLGAPDENQVLNVLPGHRLLLKGKGYEAVKLTVTGSFFILDFCFISHTFFNTDCSIFLRINPAIYRLYLDCYHFLYNLNREKLA